MSKNILFGSNLALELISQNNQTRILAIKLQSYPKQRGPKKCIFSPKYNFKNLSRDLTLVLKEPNIKNIIFNILIWPKLFKRKLQKAARQLSGSKDYDGTINVFFKTNEAKLFFFWQNFSFNCDLKLQRNFRTVNVSASQKNK